MEKKGQASSLDLIFVFLILATTIGIVYSLPRQEQNRIQNKKSAYTHQLLHVTMQEKLEGKTHAELASAYCTGSKVNTSALNRSIENTINTYVQKEWILYIQYENKSIRLPKRRDQLEGKSITSSRLNLYTAEGRMPVYLFIKWR